MRLELPKIRRYLNLLQDFFARWNIKLKVDLNKTFKAIVKIKNKHIPNINVDPIFE